MTMALALAGCGAGDRAGERDGTKQAPRVAEMGADGGGRPSAFARCATCHQTAPGRNGVGPSLAGVYGAPAGHEATYAYSKALRHSGLVWDAETLDAYLADPRGVVPGTKMAFAGVRSAEERAAIVAYLQTL
ncbi:c-type cytochrome [Pelagerythrobacter marensis]|uniref:C-type cytochrome n=1 Tax=Pelagerythrobacter marensis TaxID=543877 RepID=A0ABZ2D6A5_9SPHN